MESRKDAQFAVYIDRLSKAYNSPSATVFEDVHLKLPTGKIYGLLGPSGCGKTTLLRCILGRIQPDHGRILVFGHPTGTEGSGIPGPNVGYMPQETCVYDTMTIGECLRYYGRLAKMTEQRITIAIDNILDLLSLPSPSTLNHTLSGGQLRRVAFAIALLHEPKLLILDEPTVGIDPITKERMWQYLMKLTRVNGTSIIITTHYIEEARAAHKVGLMHGKTMVDEDYTDHLLVKYGCVTLEEVFLKICHGTKPTLPANEVIEECPDDSFILQLNDNSTSSAITSHKRSILPHMKDLKVRPQIVKAVFIKNFLNMYRFPGALIFLLLLPCIQVTTAVYGIGGAFCDLTVAVANNDAGPLGEVFLSQLEPWLFKQVPYPTFQDGMTAVRDGKTYGAIGIGQNFSDTFRVRVLDGFLKQAEVFNHSTISLALDDTHYLINSVSKYHILDTFQRFQDIVVRNDTTANPLHSSLVVQFDHETLESFKNASSFSLVLGTSVSAAFFAPVGVVVCTLYIERIKGHLERTCIAGVSSMEIILGMMSLLALMLIIQIALILIPIVWTLESMQIGSSVLVGLLLFFEGINGMTIGLCLSLAVDQVYILMLAAGLAMTVVPAFGGYVWPLQALPSFARPFYLASPYACPIQAILYVVFRGWNLSRPEVQWGCWSPFLWATILGMATLVLFRIKV